jgi:lysyl-tRNA synthetase class I
MQLSSLTHSFDFPDGAPVFRMVHVHDDGRVFVEMRYMHDALTKVGYKRKRYDWQNDAFRLLQNMGSPLSEVTSPAQCNSFSEHDSFGQPLAS